jgi:ethanolaminephosphotransferase
MFKYTYVPKKGLENLSKYHYSGVDKSILAKYILQPFWTRAVNWLPAWMAPNLVTLLGFFGIILAYLVLVVYYSPDLYQPAPGWAYLLAAASIFFYQTMDALDGKQARRTGTSSPLGELFDHGCDALNTTLATLTAGVPLRSGPGWLSYFSLLSLLVPFYMTQWEEYYSGSLYLGPINVTEGQVMSMLVHTLAYIYGPDFFLTQFTVFGYTVQYNHVVLGVIVLTGVTTTLNSIFSVIKMIGQGKATLYSAARNAVPLISLMTLAVVWPLYSPLNLPQQHPQLLFLTVGLLLANLVGRVVVARVCLLNVDVFYYILVPFTAVTVNSVFFQGSLFNEYYFLLGYCAFTLVAYLHFALNIIDEMCTHLKIRCLHIPYPNQASKAH